MRNAVVSIILLMLLIATLCVINDSSTNAGLPLVQSSLRDYPKDHMLFSPCPGGQFAPRPRRNIV